MKRANHLFERIVDLDNLREAFGRAARGKRNRWTTRAFSAQLDHQLNLLRAGLLSESYPLGRFEHFLIHDRKERIITAPCFAERVLHHAIIRVCEPVFEKWLIDDTFACRRGKGRIAALNRAVSFHRRWPVYLKLDIRKYFDSISHDHFQEALEARFKDRRLLRLFESVVRSFRGANGVGLPIGSLTSQHFANFYLGRFDRFVKETLRCRGYVRYMDDMVLWGTTTAELSSLGEQCAEFLESNLCLHLKSPTDLNRCGWGMNFLGCRVFPTHLELNRQSKLRLRRKLRKLEAAFQCGELTERELQQCGTALFAFATAGKVSSWKCRTHVLQTVQVSGHEARTG